MYALIIACLSCCWDAITLCFKQLEIEKRCYLSVLKFHDTAIFFPSHRKSHRRERIYMSTTCSYFEMTNTMMKQKKFPIKINHMSDFSSDSASSQLRKYAFAADHGVNTYLCFTQSGPQRNKQKYELALTMRINTKAFQEQTISCFYQCTPERKRCTHLLALGNA